MLTRRAITRWGRAGHRRQASSCSCLLVRPVALASRCCVVCRGRPGPNNFVPPTTLRSLACGPARTCNPMPSPWLSAPASRGDACLQDRFKRRHALGALLLGVKLPVAAVPLWYPGRHVVATAQAASKGGCSWASMRNKAVSLVGRLSCPLNRRTNQAPSNTTPCRRLFEYIDGANNEAVKIPMTAPVRTTVGAAAGPFCKVRMGKQPGGWGGGTVLAGSAQGCRGGAAAACLPALAMTP